MHTKTEEAELNIEDKAKYMQAKEKHLRAYKALASELEYAVDDVETGFITGKREKLALKIKNLSEILREIDSMEKLA
jgi:hypothetical protein